MLSDLAYMTVIFVLFFSITFDFSYWSAETEWPV